MLCRGGLLLATFERTALRNVFQRDTAQVIRSVHGTAIRGAYAHRYGLIGVGNAKDENTARSDGDRFLLPADKSCSDCRVVYSRHGETQGQIVAALLADFIGKARVVREIAEVSADGKAVNLDPVLQVSYVFSVEIEA